MNQNAALNPQVFRLLGLNPTYAQGYNPSDIQSKLDAAQQTYNTNFAQWNREADKYQSNIDNPEGRAYWWARSDRNNQSTINDLKTQLANPQYGGFDITPGGYIDTIGNVLSQQGALVQNMLQKGAPADPVLKQ